MAAVLTAGLVTSPLSVSAAPNDAAANSVSVSSQSQDQSVKEDGQDSQTSIVTPSAEDAETSGTSNTSNTSDKTSDEDNNGTVTATDDSHNTGDSGDSADAGHTGSAEDKGNAKDKENTENLENTENFDGTDTSEDSADQLSAEEVGKQIQDLIETSTQTATTSTDEVADMQDQAEKIQEAYDALPEEEQALLDDSKDALDNAQASLDTYQDALQEVEETGTVTIDPNAPANSFRYINGQPVAEALADVEEETAQAEAVADGLDPELVQEYNIQPTEGSTTGLKASNTENTDLDDLNIIELPAAQTELLGAVSGAQHRGIDVSQFQHTINWDAVKNSGIEFAIIRCGDGPSYNDSQFERNVSECERLGIPYGVYLYGRATSEAAAQQEAAHTLSLLGGHMPQLPVYYDIEENSMRALGNSRLSSIAKAYCTTLLLDGYDTGVYSSTSWWQGSGAVLSDFASNDYFYHWVAQWAAANTYQGRYECWQYTVGDAGTVPGISTRIDMDYWYGDLSANKADAFFADIPNLGSGVNPMYRMYNPNSGEHFYTANKTERNMLFGYGWNYEGIGWFAPASSGTPVYRLYNPNAGDHHYTTNIAERNMLISVGWNDEGIGWYSDDNGAVPLYRQYNPNAKAGSHNYTTSKGENDFLAANGWNAEGIGWYGLYISY